MLAFTGVIDRKIIVQSFDSFIFFSPSLKGLDDVMINLENSEYLKTFSKYNSEGFFFSSLSKPTPKKDKEMCDTNYIFVYISTLKREIIISF